MTAEISSAEWQVMRVLWAKEEATSREVIEYLSEAMEWKPGTIKTLLGRLREKGFISARESGRHFIYRAEVTESERVQHILQELFNEICDRDAGRMLGIFLENIELSKSDIDHLSAQLAQKRENAPEQLVCHCLPGQCQCQPS